MLLNIHVRNMALIEEADIELQPGLTIMSGETGAGKSIIIGSVNAALGGKTSPDIIRKGAEYALAELTFKVDNAQVLEGLRLLGVGELEEGIVLVSRKIMASRSVIKVNGETVTATVMKKIAALLIDIHGQNEHQSLLYEDRHLELLDRFLPASGIKLKEELGSEYARFIELKKKLSGFDIDEDEKKRRIDFLEYEIQEITSAGITVGEDEDLERLFTRMNNAQKILRELSFVQALVSGDDAENVGSMLGKCMRSLGNIENLDADIASLNGRLREIDSLLGDFSGELSAYAHSMDFDDAQYARCGERLDLINGLKAKYGRTIEDINDGLAKRQRELEGLQKLDLERDELKSGLLAIQNSMTVLCDKLSAARKKTGKALSDSVKKSLADLNFLDSRFEVEITDKGDFGADGADRVRFLIATNPGEDLKPLAKIASGGEMSRIMLAIKAALAGRDEIQSLIFDEIDTGISGKTASMVAKVMHSMASTHQLLCITHLPQIASAADSHFLIRKDVDGGKTVTTIRRLDDEESVLEVARLLGGDKVTDAAIANAREMKACI